MVHSSIFVNSKLLETFWFYDFVIKILSIAFTCIKAHYLWKSKFFNLTEIRISISESWTVLETVFAKRELKFGTITLEWFVATKLANIFKIDNSLKGQIITRSRFLWMTGLVKLFYWPVELGFKNDWPWRNGCRLKLLTWIIQK